MLVKIQSKFSQTESNVSQDPIKVQLVAHATVSHFKLRPSRELSLTDDFWGRVVSHHLLGLAKVR